LRLGLNYQFGYGAPSANAPLVTKAPAILVGAGVGFERRIPGFTSGEAYKVGFDYPYARVNRYFIRQTIDLALPWPA
jgi:hypothetical protein